MWCWPSLGPIICANAYCLKGYGAKRVSFFHFFAQGCGEFNLCTRTLYACGDLLQFQFYLPWDEEEFVIFAPDSFKILKKIYNSTILAFLNVLPCTLYQRHILNNIH